LPGTRTIGVIRAAALRCDLRRGIDIERAVLHVDEQPLEAARLADRSDVDLCAWRNFRPSAQFAGSELRLV
jgi:hypothetical protein